MSAITDYIDGMNTCVPGRTSSFWAGAAPVDYPSVPARVHPQARAPARRGAAPIAPEPC